MKRKNHEMKLETHEINGASGNEPSIAIIIKSVHETKFPMVSKMDALEIHEILEHHLPFSTYMELRWLFKTNEFGRIKDDNEI